MNIQEKIEKRTINGVEFLEDKRIKTENNLIPIVKSEKESVDTDFYIQSTAIGRLLENVGGAINWEELMIVETQDNYILAKLKDDLI